MTDKVSFWIDQDKLALIEKASFSEQIVPDLITFFERQNQWPCVVLVGCDVFRNILEEGRSGKYGFTFETSLYRWRHDEADLRHLDIFSLKIIFVPWMYGVLPLSKAAFTNIQAEL